MYWGFMIDRYFIKSFICTCIFVGTLMGVIIGLSFLFIWFAWAVVAAASLFFIWFYRLDAKLIISPAPSLGKRGIVYFIIYCISLPINAVRSFILLLKKAILVRNE